MTQTERNAHAFAELVRMVSASIWSAASVGDTERVKSEAFCLMQDAINRKREIEAAQDTEETAPAEYDLTELNRLLGDEGTEQ